MPRDYYEQDRRDRKHVQDRMGYPDPRGPERDSYYRPDLDARNYSQYKGTDVRPPDKVAMRGEEARETYYEQDVEFTRHKKRKKNKRKRSRERDQASAGDLDRKKSLVAYDDISSDSDLPVSEEAPSAKHSRAESQRKPRAEHGERTQSPGTAIQEYKRSRDEAAYTSADKYSRRDEGHRSHRESPAEPSSKKSRQHSPK